MNPRYGYLLLSSGLLAGLLWVAGFDFHRHPALSLWLFSGVGFGGYIWGLICEDMEDDE